MSDDWAPDHPPEVDAEYKWGLDADSGAFTIWSVSGPGDGLPTHNAHIAEVWGREPTARDTLGHATVIRQTIRFVAYQGRPVPAAALAWARTQHLSTEESS